MSETDAEFLDRLQPSWPGTNDSVRLPMSDFDRLFALARRGAAVDTNPQTVGETVREDVPKGFMAGWLLGVADAAKCADEFADKWATVWRKGLKCDSHLEGMSDGADDVAQAIRALPPPPAGETNER